MKKQIINIPSIIYYCIFNLAVGFALSVVTSCDEPKSCQSDQDCAAGYRCDLEGYCTQLTAYVRCGEQLCFAPEICINGQSCMVVDRPDSITGGVEVPLTDMRIEDKDVELPIDRGILDVSVDSTIDGFMYSDYQTRDMYIPPDMSENPLLRDQGGQTCQSACDCSPGLACNAGLCESSSQPIYCCGDTFCPPGEACETMSGAMDICLDSACSTACDCNPGLSCIDNLCQLGDDPLFCCDQGSCPTGNACETRQGVRSMCPISACHSACDCSPGQRCVDGQCLLQGDPIFCCDQNPCPNGEACQNQSGTLALCGGESTCQTACDCMTGLSCINQECILDNSALYCCEDNFCPQGERCQSSAGGPILTCEG